MVATRRGDKGKGGDKGKKKGVTTRSGGRGVVPVEVEAAGTEEEVEEVEGGAVGEFLERRPVVTSLLQDFCVRGTKV